MSLWPLSRLDGWSASGSPQFEVFRTTSLPANYSSKGLFLALAFDHWAWSLKWIIPDMSTPSPSPFDPNSRVIRFVDCS